MISPANVTIGRQSMNRKESASTINDVRYPDIKDVDLDLVLVASHFSPFAAHVLCSTCAELRLLRLS